jgi:hypothetical protein
MIPYEQLELTIKNDDLIPAHITLVNCWYLCITMGLAMCNPKDEYLFSFNNWLS